MMGSPELLPCPFCGHEAKLFNTEMPNCAFVQCQKCKASSDDRHIERAVSAWNTRADHALSLVAEAYEVAGARLREMSDVEMDLGRVAHAGLLDAASGIVEESTPSNALAAREADRKRVRDEALHAIEDRINNTDYGMSYHAPLTRFIRNIIEGDQT